MRVKFIKFGSNSQIGGFGPGDVATVSDVLAGHLVDDAGVAVYATEAAASPSAGAAPAPAQRNARAPAAAKPAKSRKA